MSKAGSRSLGNELRVKLVDYEDFVNSDPKSVTSFFNDIGALNSAFKKRIAQLESLHMCSPLGKAAEEYLMHQKALEQKHGIKVDDFYDSENTRRFVSSESASPVAFSAATSQSRPAFDLSSFGKSSPATASSSTFPTVSDNQPESGKKRKVIEDEVSSKGFKSSDGGQTPIFSRGSVDLRETLTKARKNDKEPSSGNSVSPAKEQPAKDASLPSKIPVFSGFSLPNKDKASSSAESPLAPPPQTGFFSALNAPKPVATNIATNIAPFQGFGSFNASVKPFASSENTTDASNPTTSASTKPIWSGGFSFGSGTTASLGGFNFATPAASTNPLPKSTDGGDDEEDGEDDAVPDIPAVPDEEVAETDAILSQKCKVFYLDEGEYKVRGTGTAHLKKLGEGSLQLLIRTATSLGVVLLNTRITSQTVFTKGEGAKKNTITLVSYPEPMFKGADAKKMYQFLLKLKDEDVTAHFHGKVQESLKT